MNQNDISFISFTKKHFLKLTALVLALSVIGGMGVFAAASALTADKPEKSAAETAKVDKDDLSSLLGEIGKDKQETVYVIAKADGTVNKIIVSNLLKNAGGKAQITDKTNLKNIENVKDDRGYTLSGNACVWDAEGSDVYYSGISDLPLPVDLSIVFRLDGKEISPDALAGKSGRLEITFNYRNNVSKTVNIDGKDSTIYLPFLMMSGMIFDNEKAANITVSDGKVLSDGNRTAAVGFAFPGLSDSLQLEGDVDIPSNVTVSADVTDFELETTLTLASNDFFNALDLDHIESYDDLKKNADLLSSSAKQLADGSSALYGGINTLLEKSGELTSGIKALVLGAEQLKGGADQLVGGANELSDGSAQLSKGLTELSENSASLRDGAKQIFDLLLSTANTQISAAGLKTERLTAENYAKVLDKTIRDDLKPETVKALAEKTALDTVTKQVSAAEPQIRAGVETAVKAQVQSAVLATLGMTTEQYNAALAAGQISESVQSQVNAAVSAQMNSDKVQRQIDSLTAEQKNKLIKDNMNSDEVQSKIREAVAAAENGRKTLTALKGQLDSFNQFYRGIIRYTDGVDTATAGSDKLAGGTKDLSTGAKTLADGAKQLLDGIVSLDGGTAKLIAGVGELRDGAKTLSDGADRFNKEGVGKITSLISDDVDPLITRLRAVVDFSKEYDNYSGKADGADSSVKFIYRTDAIKK